MPKRLHSLTLVRLFAASWVLVFHFNPHAPLAEHSLWQAFSYNGFQAMPLFFALSGLVLAYSYHRLSDADAIYSFYRARFARLFPGYAIVHLLALGLMVELWQESPFQWLYTNLLSLLGLQAWCSYTFPLGINGGTWSISAEAFFYLTFPALLPALRHLTLRFGYFTPLAGLIGLSTLIGLGDVSWDIGRSITFYTSPIIRLPDFCVGVILGLALRHRPPTFRWPGLRLAAAVALFATVAVLPENFLHSTFFQFRTKGLVTLAVAGLLYAVGRHEQQRRASQPSFPVRILLYLGEASYCLFLVHILLIRLLLLPDLKPRLQLALAQGLHREAWFLFILASWGSAILLHELIEKPARRWINRRRRPAEHEFDTAAVIDLPVKREA